MCCHGILTRYTQRMIEEKLTPVIIGAVIEAYPSNSIISLF